MGGLMGDRMKAQPPNETDLMAYPIFRLSRVHEATFLGLVFDHGRTVGARPSETFQRQEPRAMSQSSIISSQVQSDPPSSYSIAH
jgi:hypothetical protein